MFEFVRGKLNFRDLKKSRYVKVTLTPTQLLTASLLVILVILFICQSLELSQITSVARRISFFTKNPYNSIEPWRKAQKALNFIKRIAEHERKIFSQQGEDGVLEVSLFLILFFFFFLNVINLVIVISTFLITLGLPISTMLNSERKTRLNV